MRRLIRSLGICFLITSGVLPAPACSGRAPDPSPTAPTPANPAIDTQPRVDAGSVKVDEITVLTLESYPVQVHLRVQVTFGDTCTEVDKIEQARSADAVSVTIHVRQGSGCTGSPRTATLEIRLDGGFVSGTYSATVNGLVRRFTI